MERKNGCVNVSATVEEGRVEMKFLFWFKW